MKTSVVVAIIIGVAILAVSAGGAAGYFIARNQISSTDYVRRTALENIGNVMLSDNKLDIMETEMKGMFDSELEFDETNHPRTQYMLDAYAEALDMTTDELKDELKSGKSFWEIASSKGIEAEDFGQFMIDAATSALNKMVADEEITQKRADAILERITENWLNVNPETCPCAAKFGARNRMWRRHLP